MEHAWKALALRGGRVCCTLALTLSDLCSGEGRMGACCRWAGGQDGHGSPHVCSQKLTSAEMAAGTESRGGGKMAQRWMCRVTQRAAPSPTHSFLRCFLKSSTRISKARCFLKPGGLCFYSHLLYAAILNTCKVGEHFSDRHRAQPAQQWRQQNVSVPPSTPFTESNGM